MDDILVSPG